MKKMFALILTMVCLLVFPTASLAALPEMYLYSPALDAMTYVGGESFEEGFEEYYMSEDGLMFVEVLTLEAGEYGMVGEGSFEGLMELRVEGDMNNAETVACEGVCAYPAQRIRFETGAEEDLSVVDATAIWTEGKTFVYIVTVDADAWYGFMDGYEDGAAQAMVDQWISELQIDGYDTDEWDFAQTLAVLVADRSCGMADGEEQGMVERYEINIEGEFDANYLADQLSELTGLDFFVNCYVDGQDRFIVDWQLDSTLVAGLDDREQKEEFFFFDVESLNWFMMDSLYGTIRETLGIEEIYYTMDGGVELQPMARAIVESFPTDIPYMGSPFYFAHSDVMGDDAADAGEFEDNEYGFFENYIETEFFRVGIPAHWRDLYEVELIQQEPFGYTFNVYEKESGFVFGLVARWFDDEVVQLESVWQGYLGRMDVEKLGFLDLLVTYSQPAPDASDAWQSMYDTCREVVETVLMQEGVSLIEGEYIEYQP